MTKYLELFAPKCSNPPPIPFHDPFARALLFGRGELCPVCDTSRGTVRVHDNRAELFGQVQRGAVLSIFGWRREAGHSLLDGGPDFRRERAEKECAGRS